MVKQKIAVKDYRGEYASRKLQYISPSLGDQLDLLHRVFVMYDNDKKSKLSLGEVRYITMLITEYPIVVFLLKAELALRSLHIEGPKLQQLLTVREPAPSTIPAQDLWHQYKKDGLTFDEFCCVYAELKSILLKSTSNSSSFLTTYVSTPLKWITSKSD